LETAVFGKPQVAELGSANARCILQHRLEYRLQFAGRRADDFKHISSGGLLLQRLAQLIEQPRILDRDNGLSGEICQ
jgi:hypothetical protein